MLGKPVEAKEILSYCALNIFSGYMCSKKFQYEQNDFQKLVQNFDYIFRDINTGHIIDFLPSLEPLFPKYINEIKKNASDIREYILKNICLEKYEKLKQNPSDVEDLVDACFSNLLVSVVCPPFGVNVLLWLVLVTSIPFLSYMYISVSFHLLFVSTIPAHLLAFFFLLPLLFLGNVILSLLILLIVFFCSLSDRERG